MVRTTRPTHEDGRLPCSGHLLLTGFEPFGGEALNPSQALLQVLDGETIGGLRVVTAVLPCAFGQAPQVVVEAIERHAPVLVLAIGQAGGRSELSFERVAINLIDARMPDNQGAQPVDLPVLPGAPAACFSTLPVKVMAAAARAAGVPAGVSHSAGTFVCNQVFYLLQHRLAKQAVPAGFLHVPWLPGQTLSRPGMPSMALETMARGVRAALVSAVDGLQRGEADTGAAAGSLH